MAFKLFLRTRCNDQISHLRRQEAPQPAHTLDFAYLVGDALLQVLIEFSKFVRLHLQLVGSLAKVVEQARVLDGDNSLSGKILDKRDLLVSEGKYFAAVNADD